MAVKWRDGYQGDLSLWWFWQLCFCSIWGRCPAERGEQSLRCAKLSAQLSVELFSPIWSHYQTTLRCTESVHWGKWYNLCWAFFTIDPPQVLRNWGAQEFEWLRCSHSDVHGGGWGEGRAFPPEVHDHLHSFEHVKLQVVKTAPDSQLLNLLTVSRLVTILNEADDCGVICKLEELDRAWL